MIRASGSGEVKYRKKPVVIEAVRWNGRNISEIILLGGGNQIEESFYSDEIVIKTLEGDMTAANGDWIIRGIKGELYPCKNDIFEATYEPVEDAQ
jgi:hypothetical protein